MFSWRCKLVVLLGLSYQLLGIIRSMLTITSLPIWVQIISWLLLLLFLIGAIRAMIRLSRKYRYTSLQNAYLNTIFLTPILLAAAFWLGQILIFTIILLASLINLCWIGLIKKQAIKNISPRSSGRSRKGVYGSEAIRVTIGYIVVEITILGTLLYLILNTK